MKSVLKETSRRVLSQSLKTLLAKAGCYEFSRQIVRDQPWLIDERTAELKKYREEMESEFQKKQNDYKESIRQQIQGCFALSPFEVTVHHEGERLLPERSHNNAETVRHKSSYYFFRRIIEQDLIAHRIALPISILDIGIGSGHGSFELSRIPGTRVTGIDVAPECLEYAKTNYQAKNIEYRIIDDIFAYTKSMPEFDYIVSRHVFEHIPNAFSLIELLRWTKRLLINVPFEEKSGNEYHLLLDITEDSFPSDPSREVFFEDLAGKTYLTKPEEIFINSICCCYAKNLPRIVDYPDFEFPLPPWKPEGEYAIVKRIINQLHGLFNFTY